MKICNYENCDNKRFSNGYCKNHLFMVDKYKALDKKFRQGSGLSSKRKDKANKQGFIKTVSNKQYKINLELTKIKKKLIKQNKGKCFFTGKTNSITLFHIFPRGQFPEYQTEEWNLLLATLDVHQTYDQGLWKDMIHIPKLKFLFRVIRNKNQRYYNRLLQKAKQSLTIDEYIFFKNKIN